MLEAHQGVASDAPGNSMAAFRLAAAEHFDMIELDPAFTMDHVCVIHHDRGIGRTDRYADGSEIPEEARKPISALTYEELRSLDIGISFHPRFAGEKIPSFEEVLAFSKTTGIPLKIDNRVEDFSPKDFKIMCEQIQAFEMEELIGITGFHLPFLKDVAAALPTAAIHYDGYVTPEALTDLNSVRKGNPLYIWMRYDNAMTAWSPTPPIIRERAELARKYGKVGVWILTEPTEAECAVRDFQADVIETTGTVKAAHWEKGFFCK